MRGRLSPRCRCFGVSAAAINEGIARASWPGRLERVSTNPDIILDGAHNPAGARALAAYIQRFFADEPVRIVYGAMRDKAISEVINILFPLAAEVVLTAPDQPRALNPRSVAESADHPNIRIAETVGDALRIVHGKSDDDVYYRLPVSRSAMSPPGAFGFRRRIAGDDGPRACIPMRASRGCSFRRRGDGFRTSDDRRIR